MEEDLADTLFELSTVLTELEQPSEAVPLLRRCLQIQMARHGEQSEDALMCNELLAKALSEADQKGEEVVQTLRRGLEMKRNVHGEDSQEVADAHNELAVALQEMGESQLAEQEARNALSLHIELFGESHMYTGTCICNLATLLQQQNKLHPAEMLLRHCLRIYEAELGATHEDTVEVIASLVDVLWYLKRVDEACSLLTRQLDLQSKQPDIDPVVLAQGHAALGALHWERKDADAALSAFEKAEDNYQQAIDSLDSTLPETAEEEEELAERRLDLGTELASCLNSMGIVLQEQGHPEKALARLLRAVQLYEVTMGPQHAFVGIGHHNLGLIRFELGQLEPARRSLEIAVEVCRHSLGTLHRDFRGALESLKHVLYETGQPFEACEPLMRAEAQARDEALSCLQSNIRLRRKRRLRGVYIPLQGLPPPPPRSRRPLSFRKASFRKESFSKNGNMPMMRRGQSFGKGGQSFDKRGSFPLMMRGTQSFSRVQYNGQPESESPEPPERISERGNDEGWPDDEPGLGTPPPPPPARRRSRVSGEGSASATPAKEEEEESPSAAPAPSIAEMSSDAAASAAIAAGLPPPPPPRRQSKSDAAPSGADFPPPPPPRAIKTDTAEKYADLLDPTNSPSKPAPTISHAVAQAVAEAAKGVVALPGDDIIIMPTMYGGVAMPGEVPRGFMVSPPAGSEPPPKWDGVMPADFGDDPDDDEPIGAGVPITLENFHSFTNAARQHLTRVVSFKKTEKEEKAAPAAAGERSLFTDPSAAAFGDSTTLSPLKRVDSPDHGREWLAPTATYPKKAPGKLTAPAVFQQAPAPPPPPRAPYIRREPAEWVRADDAPPALKTPAPIVAMARKSFSKAPPAAEQKSGTNVRALTNDLNASGSLLPPTIDGDAPSSTFPDTPTKKPPSRLGMQWPPRGPDGGAISAPGNIPPTAPPRRRSYGAAASVDESPATVRTRTTAFKRPENPAEMKDDAVSRLSRGNSGSGRASSPTDGASSVKILSQ